MVTIFHKNCYHLFLNSKFVRVFVFYKMRPLVSKESMVTCCLGGHLFLVGGGYTCAPGKQSKHGHLFFGRSLIVGGPLVSKVSMVTCF